MRYLLIIMLLGACAGYSYTLRPSVGAATRTNGEVTGLLAGAELVPERKLEPERRYPDPPGDPAKWMPLHPEKEPVWFRDEERVRDLLLWVGGGISVFLLMAWKKVRKLALRIAGRKDPDEQSLESAD